ncbi:hypothetical protein ANCDUO_25392, partial [Ancylostoma duodenale]
MFIFNESSALYPSIYLGFNAPSDQRFRYVQHDLCSTIKQPADLGIDGIIIWSSSANMIARCPHIESNMNGGIGLLALF